MNRNYSHVGGGVLIGIFLISVYVGSYFWTFEPDSMTLDARPPSYRYWKNSETGAGIASRLYSPIYRIHKRVRFGNIESYVQNAAPVAEVVKYDSDWQFVILNRGLDHGVARGQKFIVRRNGELVCRIHIDEVEINLSTADLLERLRYDPRLPKPAAGDEVIPDFTD
ncbi:MAG: hypothetical protein ACI8UO_003984 [Verrucomicrobiales bacterium]|jgi:hypothetical protein